MSIVVNELKIPGSKRKIARSNKRIEEGRRKTAVGKKLTKGSEDKDRILAEGKEMLAEGKEMLAEGKKVLAEGHRLHKIRRELRFIDSFRFMASGLHSLSRNLVVVNGMMCKECPTQTKLNHINEDYVAHGKCRKC